MLTQKDDGGVDHPVAYYSKKLDKHQVNYSTIQKEALASQRSLEHFEVYLQASPHTVEVYTDNNPLTFVNKMKTKSRRLLNWSLAMQEYNYQPYKRQRQYNTRCTRCTIRMRIFPHELVLKYTNHLKASFHYAFSSRGENCYDHIM